MNQQKIKESILSKLAEKPKKFEFITWLFKTYTIKKITKNRTIDQNSLLWFWFTHLANETDMYNKDIWHVIFKYRHLMKPLKDTSMIPEHSRAILHDSALEYVYIPEMAQLSEYLVYSTTILPKPEFAKYLNLINQDCAEMGYPLPLPTNQKMMAYYDEIMKYV